MRRRGDPRMGDDLARALAFAQERDLDGYVQYLLGARANLRAFRGEWPAAEADARASLALGEHRGVSLCPALIALGRLQARRGDLEAGATLQEAWRTAEATARSIAGDWRAAAAAWTALGFPFEAADACAEGDDEDARLEALATFDRLGATRCAQRLRQRLRAGGTRRVPRGPDRPRAAIRPGSLRARPRCWSSSSRARRTPRSRASS